MIHKTKKEEGLRSEFRLIRRVLRPISAVFDRFRHVSAVSAVSVAGRYDPIWPIRPDSGRISPIRRESKPIRRESSRVGANPADSARIREKKKKKNSDAAGLAVNHVGRRIPRRTASDSGAPPSQSRPCFLARWHGVEVDQLLHPHNFVLGK